MGDYCAAVLTTVNCTMNTEACDVLLDKVVGAVKGTVEKIRDLEHYPELLKKTDLAVARFIDGKISREEFVTVLADAGHIAGTAESVLVGLGLSTLGGGKLLGGRVGVPNRTLSQIDDYVDLTKGAREHILKYHRPGAGKPDKTEFPSHWDDERIIHQISDIATDPSLVRQVDNRGTPYVVGTRDGIEIQVNFFPDDNAKAGQITTGYPINVPANPGP